MRALRSSFQRKAIRALGMRSENVIGVADLLGRRDSPLHLVKEISKPEFYEWRDRRSGFIEAIAHGPIRIFQIDAAIVDLEYAAVYLPNGKLIAESTVWTSLRFLMNNPRPPSGGDTDYSDGFSVLPNSSFYHFLTEDLPRVGWILENFADRKLICRDGASRYVVDSAQLLGTEVTETRATHLEVRGYPFVSFPTASSGWPARNTVDFVRNLGLRSTLARSPQKGNKIYVSRLQDSRSPVNERDVIQLAEHHGFQAIQAEDFPLLDQIALFASADEILGVHGAGLSNLVWMPTGGKVIEIMSPEYYNSCYQWLSQRVGHQHVTVMNSIDSPDTVDLSAVESVL